MIMSKLKTDSPSGNGDRKYRFSQRLKGVTDGMLCEAAAGKKTKKLHSRRETLS